MIGSGMREHFDVWAVEFRIPKLTALQSIPVCPSIRLDRETRFKSFLFALHRHQAENKVPINSAPRSPQRRTVEREGNGLFDGMISFKLNHLRFVL